MKKLIKLENDFYIVDDSEIKELDYVMPFLLDDIPEVHYKKITHSTKQLDGVIKIDIKEIEEIICGYSIENLTSNCAVNYSHSLYQFAKDRFKDGFNAHKELTKNKLYTKEDLMQFVDYMYESKTAHRYKDGIGDFSVFRTLMSHYVRHLEKSEWSIEIDENNKFKLL